MGVMTEEERFYSKVSKDCWIWTGAQQTNGYGKVGRQADGNRRFIAAHRWSWMLTKGPIPKGMLVLHRCDVKLCVNPEHLFLGTDMDNSKDMYAKGRDRACGERNHHATLTDAQVTEIIAKATGKWGEGASLALEYGVTAGVIRSLLKGDTWKHLPRSRQPTRFNTGRRSLKRLAATTLPLTKEK